MSVPLLVCSICVTACCFTKNSQNTLITRFMESYSSMSISCKYIERQSSDILDSVHAASRTKQISTELAKLILIKTCIFL